MKVYKCPNCYSPPFNRVNYLECTKCGIRGPWAMPLYKDPTKPYFEAMIECNEKDEKIAKQNWNKLCHAYIYGDDSLAPSLDNNEDEEIDPNLYIEMPE